LVEAIQKIEEQKEKSQKLDIQVGYTLEKKIILEAWARYRPNMSGNYNKKCKTAFSKTGDDLQKKFSKEFIDKMLANIHFKIYDYSATTEQKNMKKGFKEEFTKIYKEKMQDN
jgi:hypothetical protein